MEIFIQKLTQAYDKIIFDTPPVLAVSDAVILSTKTDVIFLVVKENTTHRKAALRAKEIISSVKANLLGAVLNMSKPGKGYGYYYYYYYGYGQERKKKRKKGEK
jgi:Mrp family chromosome partitioning ATPase